MHQIAKDMLTGQDTRFLAVVNGVPPIWANLGQIVTEAKTAEEALTLAHIPFELLEAPIYTHWTANGNEGTLQTAPGIVPAFGYHGAARKIDDYKAIVHTCAIKTEVTKYEETIES